MKKLIRRLLVFCSCIMALFLLLCLAVIASGNWLLAGMDKPAKAEAIVILAGEPSRAIYAAELFKQGFAPVVYISRPIRVSSLKLLDELGVVTPLAEEINRQVLLKKGVPDAAIRFFGQASLSTVEEAEELAKIFPGQETFLVVTSPYHARRSKIIFQDKVKNHLVFVVATPYSNFSRRWWKDQDSAVAVVTELAKLVFYKSGGVFRSRQR
jgi:uncharacterized SAM-binding protein YcdF (DUF218 family)